VRFPRLQDPEHTAAIAGRLGDDFAARCTILWLSIVAQTKDRDEKRYADRFTVTPIHARNINYPTAAVYNISYQCAFRTYITMDEWS
jgi:hypothetical protein